MISSTYNSRNSLLYSYCSNMRIYLKTNTFKPRLQHNKYLCLVFSCITLFTDFRTVTPTYQTAPTVATIIAAGTNRIIRLAPSKIPVLLASAGRAVVVLLLVDSTSSGSSAALSTGQSSTLQPAGVAESVETKSYPASVHWTTPIPLYTVTSSNPPNDWRCSIAAADRPPLLQYTTIVLVPQSRQPISSTGISTASCKFGNQVASGIFRCCLYIEGMHNNNYSV